MLRSTSRLPHHASSTTCICLRRRHPRPQPGDRLLRADLARPLGLRRHRCLHHDHPRRRPRLELLRHDPGRGRRCASSSASLVGLPALRIRGLYLAIVTLAVAYVFPTLVLKYDELHRRPERQEARRDRRCCRRRGRRSTRRRPVRPPLCVHYFVILAIAAVLFVLARNFIKSRVGRALIALRDNQTSAAVSGVNLPLLQDDDLRRQRRRRRRRRLDADDRDSRSATDTQFGLELAIFLVVGLVIGGVGTISGAIPGALLFVFVPYYMSRVEPTTVRRFLRGHGRAPARSPGVFFGVVLLGCSSSSCPAGSSTACAGCGPASSGSSRTRRGCAERPRRGHRRRPSRRRRTPSWSPIATAPKPDINNQPGGVPNEKRTSGEAPTALARVAGARRRSVRRRRQERAARRPPRQPAATTAATATTAAAPRRRPAAAATTTAAAATHRAHAASRPSGRASTASTRAIDGHVQGRRRLRASTRPSARRTGTSTRASPTPRSTCSTACPTVGPAGRVRPHRRRLPTATSTTSTRTVASTVARSSSTSRTTGTTRPRRKTNVDEALRPDKYAAFMTVLGTPNNLAIWDDTQRRVHAAAAQRHRCRAVG